MIRKRLKPGGVPSLPEVHPGEKAVESIEVSHEAISTSHEEQTAGSSFLETGRITLDLPTFEANQESDNGSRPTSARNDNEPG